MRSRGARRLKRTAREAAGVIRITNGEHAAEAILWPALATLLRHYPDIKAELVGRLWADRQSSRSANDAGVRLGESGEGLIAVRIGPDFRMASSGAPSYFARRPRPKKPQDLTAHTSINLRLPTYGGLYAWNSKNAAVS